jgi:hypothetical protein
MCAAYSADRKNIATGGGGGPFLLDAETSRVAQAFLHAALVAAVVFSLDGTRVVAGR